MKQQITNKTSKTAKTEHINRRRFQCQNWSKNQMLQGNSDKKLKATNIISR